MYGHGNYAPPQRAQVRVPLNEHRPEDPSLHFSQGISSSQSSLAPQSFQSVTPTMGPSVAPAYQQPFPSPAQQGHAFQILPGGIRSAALSYLRPPQTSAQHVRDRFSPANNYYPNVAQGMQWPLNMIQTQPHGPFLGPRLPGQIPRNPEMFSPSLPPNPLMLQSQSGIPTHPRHPAGLHPITLPLLPPPPPITPGFLPPPPVRSSSPGLPDYVLSFPKPPLPSSPPPLSPSPPPPSPLHSSCKDTRPSSPSCFVSGFRNNPLPPLPPPPPIPPGFLPPPPARSNIPGQPDSVFSFPRPSLPASSPPLSPSPPTSVSPSHSSCIDTIPSPSCFVTGFRNNPAPGPASSLPGDVMINSVGFDTSSKTSISENIISTNDRSQNSEVRTSQELHTIVKHLACTELEFPPSSSKLETTQDSDSDMEMEG